ncbi:MAG: aminoacyl-tRNA hydrolase [Pseudomonadota bacterium]
MHLLAGLGNPGATYRGTRHNVGFEALEILARKNGLDFDQNRFESRVCRGRIKGVDVLLIQPQTYMNLSGNAVAKFVNFFKIELEKILVLHDEMDVETGRLKVSARGGPAGHKGVASIIERLGGGEFARIKIGVGRPVGRMPADSHVLGRFRPEERESVENVLVWAAEAAEVFVTQGVVEAQARYNRKDIV